jgi:hypothetical protein
MPSICERPGPGPGPVKFRLYEDANQHGNNHPDGIHNHLGGH